MTDRRSLSIVLGGGVALGAYQAGVVEVLHRHPDVALAWVAGSSAGAINGALIAGTAPETTVKALEDYWRPASLLQVEPPVRRGPLRHAFNWLSVARGRLLGSPGHLHPGAHDAIYDLAPTVSYLRKTVDFGRLNSGEIRFTVAAVDIESGAPVYFDTGRGDRIEMDHLLASCGFLPEFAPVEIGGRLLGDGGLAVNVPVEPVLEERTKGSDVVFVVDLYARDGPRPTTLEAAFQRKNELLFANQTWCRLDLYRRLRAELGRDQPNVLHLSYRPLAEEAGAEAAFDFSRASAEDRWREGQLDAGEAVALLMERRLSGPLTSIRRSAAARN